MLGSAFVVGTLQAQGLVLDQASSQGPGHGGHPTNFMPALVPNQGFSSGPPFF